MFVKLAGDCPDLGLEEVFSIHEVLGLSVKLVERVERYCRMASEIDPKEVLDRAAFIRDAGYFLSKSEDPKEVAVAFYELGLRGTFKVDAVGFERQEKEEVDRELGGLVSNFGFEVDVKWPDWIIRIDKVGWAWAVPNFKRERWVKRFPRRRPFFHPSALRPRIARAMANLARPRNVIIDPFVGTGSILIEAGLLGVYGIGCDIDRKMAVGCKKNVEFYGVLADVVQADARRLPFRTLPAVATDLPYGRSSSTHGVKFESLLTEFLDEMRGLLEGRAVIMYPSKYRRMVKEDKGFDLYVHKNLMRRVSVVKFEED